MKNQLMEVLVFKGYPHYKTTSQIVPSEVQSYVPFLRYSGFCIFKACVSYFHQILIFSLNDSPSKTMKTANCFLFQLKSSFCSGDIQFFVFLFFPLFLPVSHCFRGWSKINLKVHDVTNCLNKNSITHFAWHLGKEKRYDNETLSIDGEYQLKNIFIEKSCRKYAAKTVPRPLYNFSK